MRLSEQAKAHGQHKDGATSLLSRCIQHQAFDAPGIASHQGVLPLCQAPRQVCRHMLGLHTGRSAAQNAHGRLRQEAQLAAIEEQIGQTLLRQMVSERLGIGCVVAQEDPNALARESLQEGHLFGDLGFCAPELSQLVCREPQFLRQLRVWPPKGGSQGPFFFQAPALDDLLGHLAFERAALEHGQPGCGFFGFLFVDHDSALRQSIGY